MAGKVKIGLIQASASEDRRTNLEKALKKISEAAAKGARIVCLQELFLTRYFPQTADQSNFSLAEPVPGETSAALCGAAKKNGVCVIGSLFEKRSAGVYHNTAIVINESGRIVQTYRKMHIPDDPRFYEKFYFAPGDSGFGSVKAGGAKIGVLVCWDQWYPEAARLASLSGAQVIFYPTAIGWGGSDRLDKRLREEQLDAWTTIQRSHAIANGVFVAAVNRVGVEGDIEFWGSSFACAPSGRVMASASRGREEVLLAECDLSLISEQREGWPFLRDRRIDAYGGLSKRFLD